ncbi:hypothetical protein KB20921_33900 [Edwardsiella ictaluri]|nr:hypothetical protein KH20906_33810 [Edwardsiella ictaluri]BEI04129.1 hypothetical protein KB20921_33900 [Edwardsiella ictaluri]BEI07584.1 hypothetical protein KH201010_33700 [Edwardsiella ictaluri]BEI11056.1 hypothetical protein STU22726_33870 [Edwardsiella ictaluri]BEI14535.1 hypothetical protein STU22816_33880 [Edwardsiella ictaluri]
MGIDKTGLAVKQLAVIALIESLTHSGLLIYYAVGMTQDIGKGRADEAGIITVEWVLVKFDNAADSVTEGLRWDGSPVGTPSTDAELPFDYGNLSPLFNQSHGGTLTPGT